MKEKNTSIEAASTVGYETIEANARSRIQEWLQGLLEAEVTEFLGRAGRRRADPRGRLRALGRGSARPDPHPRHLGARRQRLAVQRAERRLGVPRVPRPRRDSRRCCSATGATRCPA